MKGCTALLFMLLISCSPYSKGLQEDHFSFLERFRRQWSAGANGFYRCKDLSDQQKSPFQTNGFLLEAEWEQHADALSGLSPRQVRRLFGKPSKIETGKNDLEGYEVENYYYLIEDSACNPDRHFPVFPGTYSFNRLLFVFYDGKQTDASPPRLSLPCQ